MVIQPHVRAANRLGPNISKIGEFGSMCMFSPAGNVQYTICRPIGNTGLDTESWVMIQTDHIPAAISRILDPKIAEINKKRSDFRSKSLVDANLLVSTEKEGQTVFMYPVYKTMSRNAALGIAEKLQKRKKGELRDAKLAFNKKTPAVEQSENLRNTQLAADVINFIEENVREEEVKVRKHLNSTVVKALEATATRSNHRTLIGAFGNEPQVKMSGMTGKSLVDVMATMHKKILDAMMPTAE